MGRLEAHGQNMARNRDALTCREDKKEMSGGGVGNYIEHPALGRRMRTGVGGGSQTLYNPHMLKKGTCQECISITDAHTTNSAPNYVCCGPQRTEYLVLPWTAKKVTLQNPNVVTHPWQALQPT